MPDQLQLRGGTTTEHNSFTGVSKEVTVDTTKKTLVVHDGSTAGGTPLMKESGGNSASAVSIGTGGTNAININSSQRVGIGEPSPSSKLHINCGSDNTAVQITSTDAGSFYQAIDNTGESIFGHSGSNAIISVDPGASVSSSAIVFQVDANSEKMRIDSSGHVGIGMTPSGVRLDVTSSVNDIARFSGPNSGGITIRNDTTNEIQIHTGTNDALIFGTNGENERMRIDSSGNVGIGTNPTDTGGYGKALDITGGSGGAAIYLRTSNGDTGQIALGAADLTIRTRQADPIIFSTNNSERMRIDSSGRLLIGTTTEGESTADNLTIADSSNCGITIRSGSSNEGNIFFSDGTAGASEYRGSIQYNHGSNYLTIGTDASERMRIDSGGVTIKGSSNATARLLLQNTSSVRTNYIGLADDDDNIIISADASSQGSGSNIQFDVDGSEIMRITNNLVGIGNAIPSSFHSSGNNLVVGSGSGDEGMTFYTGNGSSAAINFADGTSGSQSYMGRILYRHSDDSMTFHTNTGAERMRINSSGNVGIGGSAPNYQLHCTTGIGVGAHGFAQQLSIGNNSIQSLVLGTGYTNLSLNALGGSVTVGATSYGGGGSNPALYLSNTSGRQLKIHNPNAATTSIQLTNATTGQGEDNGPQIFCNSSGMLGFNNKHNISSSAASYEYYADNASGTSKLIEQARSNGFHAFLSTESVLNLNTSQDGNGSDYFARGSKNSTTPGGGNDVFWIYEDGDMYNVNGTFTQSSDQKLKENIVDASSQWNDIKALKFRKFNFKASTGLDTHTQLGLIAQEVELVSPGLVKDRPDLTKTTDEYGKVTETDTGEVTKGVKLTILYMKGMKALQEAMNKIEILEAKVAALEAA